MPNNRIAALRHELGMNQKELGQELGVAQTTVSAWETSKTEPDSVTMGKMARLFHVSIGYLMGYEAESRTRGLSQAEYNDLEAEYERKALERELTEEEEREQIGGLSEEEIAYICRQQDIEDWKNAGAPDTIEGFLVSRMVDEQPIAKREWLYEIVQKILKAPKV